MSLKLAMEVQYQKYKKDDYHLPEKRKEKEEKFSFFNIFYYFSEAKYI